MTLTPAPPAKRVRPARWHDARLVVGVLILLLSVLIGARLVGGADRTRPVLVVAADLPEGHILAAADVREVRSRLTTAATRYYDVRETRSIVGKALDRAVAEGELLPRSAVVTLDPRTLRDVPIVVEGLRVPRLRPGDLVDIYSTSKPTKQDEEPTVTVVAKAVEVVGDPPGHDSSVKVRVVVRVPAGTVEDIVRATELTQVDVVQHLSAGTR